jgi:hypothetical protein
MENDDDIKSFEEFMWLNSYAPCFEVDANDVHILQAPSEFFSKLKVIPLIYFNNCKPKTL